MSLSMKDLAKPPLMTLHLKSVFEELHKYTEKPELRPRKFPLPPNAPFINCSLYVTVPTQVQLYSTNVWTFLDSPEAHNGEKPVFDTRCNGWTVLKVPRFKMSTDEEGCDGVFYLIKNEKDSKKNLTKLSASEEYVEHDYFLRFRGFLRIYEDEARDQYILEGLLADGRGKTQCLYRVRVINDSPDFIMYFMDLEHRIVIWTKDESVLRKKHKETGATVPETIVLEFPSELIYKMVVAILKTRVPSLYRKFIDNIQEDEASYTIKRKDSKKYSFKQPMFKRTDEVLPLVEAVQDLDINHKSPKKEVDSSTSSDSEDKMRKVDMLTRRPLLLNFIELA